MAFKARGIELFRRAFKGQLSQPHKLQNGMNTWQNCESRNQRSDCCKPKSLMDEATVPEGPWEEGFKRKNAQYNETLILGIVMFIIPAGLLYKGGLVKGYPEISIFY